MNRFTNHKHWIAVPLLAALAGCGGGTDGTGATPPPPSVTSSGVMTKGSIRLNGVHFDDTTAQINDDRGRGSVGLADGMVVKLRGTSDGTNGKADKVQVENEVRGPITTIEPNASPQFFIVGQLKVLVDTTTVFANVANFAGLALNDRVEVHGLRDDANNVHASRVERVGPANASNGFDEVRGTVSAADLNANTFTLNGNLTVNYSAATFAPVGASENALLGTGVVVEVHGTLAGATFNATQIDIENLEDADFRGDPNEHQDVEGFVTQFTATPGTFLVNGRPVTTNASTLFVNGTAADLANNVEVEAEGTIDNSGTLMASKIQFERARVQLEGPATAVDIVNRRVVVLGQTVQANDLTRIDARGSGGNSTSLADITPGVDCVQVRGALVAGVLLAEEIKEPSSCDPRVLVQAPVTAKVAATFTLQFFNTLNASLANTSTFSDRNGASLSRDAFFAAVTAAGPTTAGTLVKVRGTLDNTGVLLAQEAELEN
jgi:hypothetical protein